MYRSPVSEIGFTLKHVAEFDRVAEAYGGDELSDDLVEAILEEAGRFAAEEIAPLNPIADKHGTRLENGEVTTPPGWKEAYHAWAEGGWNGLTASPEFGGQGLPTMLWVATYEMWNSASMAFAIGPTLTAGAIEALSAHASEDLQATYMEKLVTGEWMATMNLTEPQAGSDLAALRSRAERNEDGTYSIFGQKIFITYGEHDLTDNIVHLVLARLPDAPAGTRGISLFLVPKFLLNEDGSLGERNDVACASVEHKLGIHGSPTCTMVYGDNGGAKGWIVGEENKGLACMFTMMNNARLAVGVQGLGVAEAALQRAVAYALDRRQGKASGWTGEGMAPIAMHPDVRRNLMTMRALTGVARALCYRCAAAIDMAHQSEGDDKKRWSERAALLTPIAKAMPTDIGVDVASLGVQIHGGMGYVEETGAAQLLRDARIAPIYEGTNGIQSIDLVMRKLPLSEGNEVRGFIEELRAIVTEAGAQNVDGFADMAAKVASSLDDLSAATDWLLEVLKEGRHDEAQAGATPYLRLFGLASGGAFLAQGALATARSGMSGPADKLRVQVAQFFAENLISETAALRSTVMEGAATLLAADAAYMES
ncbi:acyl-CoA dehydrogenase [Breoghania sp.]|uniref:acyl-CoA dehydrogenase n=1 Tax=Breoghania sp. TaxID=2065378 RepID=UPI0029CA3F5E|nr:acyl-CoA dehydrogenase [Breoghania sp.]